MTADHFCNAPLACPSCVKRFWKWAESWTRGRLGRHSFYEAAARMNPRAVGW